VGVGHHRYMNIQDWGGETIMLRYQRDTKIGLLAGRG
jgi:hypothetical protein